MLIHLPQVLTEAQVVECRDALQGAVWNDSREVYASNRSKKNEQVPEDHPAARRLGAMILAALDKNQLFASAALPLRVVPPLFNRYAGGQSYENHIDAAVRPVSGFGSQYRVRADLSATLFLTPPGEYDGGELAVEDSFGNFRVKFPAGDMVLYPGSAIHHVEPVTRGTRLAAFFWIESMVRDDSQRRLLFELDFALLQLRRDTPAHAAIVRLEGVYQNLLRSWALT